jgi:hypothetical protein
MPLFRVERPGLEPSARSLRYGFKRRFRGAFTPGVVTKSTISFHMRQVSMQA